MPKSNPSTPWVRAILNNKILVGVIVCLSLVVVALAVTIAMMMPLKEKIPVYVEFQTGNNNFVIVQRANKNIRSNAALISMFLRSYVASRETVDKITEEGRYGYVIALSNPSVAQNFKQLYGDKNTGLYFQEGLKRAVIVVRDNPLAPGIHQIELETTDTIDGKAGQTKSKWIVTVQYGFYDQKVVFNERLQNPMGLLVEKYSLTKRQI